MTYAESIEYLYNTLPMFSSMGSAAFKKDLTNIRLLCERLDNPHKKFKSIHVGGTNGKGSVSHMLAAILQSSGYKTGLYTSPHLYDFRERIKVDGILADEDFVIDFTEKVKPIIEEIQPSFFEITVAMAFEYFALQNVDIAIIEVGLGGRLDSTNIIDPELAVITNIGWDHMNMLGDTLEAIAFEKAGIIKQDTPVVIGERQPETIEVFNQVAVKNQAPIIYASEHYGTVCYHWQNNYLSIDVLEKERNKIHNYQLDLPGIYQTKNIVTVLAAISELRKKGFIISEFSIVNALYSVKKLTGLHGRWEIIHESPAVILEVAHNKDGIENILQHLHYISYKQLHLILGMVKDKDTSLVLELLPKDAVYYFTQAHIPRALDARSLQEKAAAYSLQGNYYEDVDTALQEALSKAFPDDLIIICGSIFLVAEVNKELVSHLA
jgi:dihydrofolate synthase/folylpolyglutamate synthase